jgi:hypothetical protein
MQTETVTNTGLNYWDDENLVERFFGKVNKTEGCWEWNAVCLKGGYGKFSIKYDTRLAHRVSFEIHHKRKIMTGMNLLHSCDNRKCVNPHHLREGTHQENIKDKVEKGRQCKGESNGQSKLKNEQVVEIRTKYATKNYTQRQLAEEYNVHNSIIYDIVHRITWKHIL